MGKDDLPVVRSRATRVRVLKRGDMSPLSLTRHVASNQSADTSAHFKGAR